MTDKDPDGNNIPEDTEVCSIKFFYDGLTNTPKLKVERNNPKEIDRLSLYAYAASEVLSEEHNRIIELLNTYIGNESFNSKYVH